MLAVESHHGSYCVPSHVLMQQLPDQGLIFLDLRSEEYFGLDAVGTRMYEAVVSSGSVEVALTQLVPEYDVDPTTLDADLRRFVAMLLERGLLAHEPG